jgi:phosphatidylserine/phosphatidylglycerophosphate/cardiolipin synthase-like enzyme
MGKFYWILTSSIFLADLAIRIALSLPGNHLELIDNPLTFFRSLIADIDRAKKSCFLEFYIWEEDGLPGEVAEAVLRASLPGVVCRVLLIMPAAPVTVN